MSPIIGGTSDSAKTEVFWGEIAPAEHVLQIYETEEAFLSTVTAFIGAGINAGDCVIVIATQEHLNALSHRLTMHGIQMADLIVEGRYIPLVASVALSKFMVNGMPDEKLFRKLVTSLLSRAKHEGRKVRAFGEMVALLWADGNKQATIALEQLWCGMVEEKEFSLLCAYPVFGFTDNPGHSIDAISEICKCHTKLIDGAENNTHMVHYSDVPPKD